MDQAAAPLPQWTSLIGSRLIDLLGWRLIDARPDVRHAGRHHECGGVRHDAGMYSPTITPWLTVSANNADRCLAAQPRPPATLIYVKPAMRIS
jgi:hypothetical protein